LRLPKFVKKQKPRSSTPRRSTARADGRASRVAVATIIASGCRAPCATASSYQRENITNGSGSASADRSSRSGTATGAAYGNDVR
jgi:hypothetical protein